MKLGGNLPLGHDALLFLIGGMGSFICPVTHSCTHQGLYLPSHGLVWGKSKYSKLEDQLYPGSSRGGGGRSSPCWGDGMQNQVCRAPGLEEFYPMVSEKM